MNPLHLGPRIFISKTGVKMYRMYYNEEVNYKMRVIQQERCCEFVTKEELAKNTVAEPLVQSPEIYKP